MQQRLPILLGELAEVCEALDEAGVGAGAGRRIRVEDELGNATTTAFDAGGNVTTVTSSEVPTGTGSDVTSVTTAVYDALGRQTEVTAPGGLVSRAAYDSRGLVRGVSDPNGPLVSGGNSHGNLTHFFYDLVGRLIRRDRLLQSGGVGTGDLFTYTLDTTNTYNSDGVISDGTAYDKNSNVIAAIAGDELRLCRATPAGGAACWGRLRSG